MHTKNAAATREDAATQAGGLIGEILVTTGALAQADVGPIVDLQKQRGVRFGEAALSLGLLQEEDIARALARQYEYPIVSPDSSGLSPLLTSAHDPFGGNTERFRNLRSQLMLRWFNDRRRMLAIVGPHSGAGCSTIAANLAVLFAQLGERTLLIDANFRNPEQHKLFGIEKRDGLATVLLGRGSIKDAITAVQPFHSLSVLTAGSSPPNPQELLTRLTFAYMAETVTSSYDIVLVDTPPAVEFADAQLIASRAGGCLLVARRHWTRAADIELVRRSIEPSGATFVGAVVSD